MKMNERMKRVFSILLCLCMLVQNAPVMAFAATTDNLCEHHTAHTAECGYVEAVAGSDCTHSHDGSCGYAEGVAEVLCACEATDENGTLVHTEGCGYVAPVTGADCTHVHDDTCGYVQTVAEQSCQYNCGICAVQALIDALPDDVTAENADAVANQLSAIDTAKAALSDEELAQVDFSRYTAAVSGISALSGQPGANTPVAASLSITVQIEGGNSYTLEVETSDTIEDVKAKISEQTNISLSKLELYFDNNKLADNSTVEACGIQNGSTLTAKIIAYANPRVYIEYGSITLSVSDGATYYQQGSDAAVPYTGEITITGTSDANSITVQSGIHDVVLRELYINASAPFDISAGATVNLYLVGTNTLTATAEGKAGLHVPNGAELTIDEPDGSTGSLTANGGRYSAGIGSQNDNSEVNLDTGKITINGGTITAEGADGGAGIGGANYCSATDIHINGGIISASSGQVILTGGGAGIGGGSLGPSANVSITGGYIAVNGTSVAAGIGTSGANGTATITISGGTIIANGGSSAQADIGYGRSSGSTATTIITGGSIKANNIANPVAAQDGASVSLKTVDIPDGYDISDLYIADGNNQSYNYRLKDVRAIEGKVYLYLPAGVTASTECSHATVSYIANGNVITASCSANCGYGGTATISATGKTYDGQPVEATVNKTGVFANTDFTVSYKVKDGEAISGAPVDAGTYIASITYNDGTSDHTASVEFTINKADSSVNKVPEAISGLKFIEENGREVQQNLVTAGEATGGTMVYRIGSDGEWSQNIPTAGQVRNYTVSYKVLGDSNHNDSAEGKVNVSIAKADAPTVTIPAQTHFYTIPTTGNRIDIKSLLPNLCAIITNQSSVTGTTGDFITNAVLDNGILTYDTVAASAPATGTITVKIVMRNYEDVTVTVNVELIELNPVSNSGTNAEIKYDGSTYDVAQMFTKDTNAGEASYAIIGGTGAGTLNGSELTITKAGTIEIKMTTAANGTYAAGEATATLTVEKADGAGSVTMDGWTYGDTAKAPTANGTGEVTFLYTGTDYSSAEAPTNAGAYTVTATFAENDLYEDATASDTFTIAKRELTPIVEGSVSKTYDGTTDVPASHSLSITVDGIVFGDDISAAASYAYDGADAGTTKVNATNITLGGADAGNYTLKATTASADVGTITKASSSITKAPEAIVGLKYNGQDQALITPGEADGGKLLYSVNGVDYSENVPTMRTPNEYHIYYKVEGDSNHTDWDDGGGIKFRVTIGKADMTVTAGDQTITHGETISANAFAADDPVEGHTVAVTLPPSTTNVTVSGTITPSVVITADGIDVTDRYYNVSLIPGKLVIQPDTSKIDGLTTENVTSANEADIQAVQEMMDAAETDGADEDTLAAWAAISETCEDLTQKIEAVEEEIARIEDAVSNYDLTTVKSSDETAISQLISDIDDQLATNNLTDAERSELEGLKTKCNNLIAKIDGTETLIEQLDKTVDDLDAETVKSTDKATLEQVIEDAQTLIDSGNVTEAEKEALKQIQEDAQALIKVIDDTAAEKKSVTDEAAAYDANSVKSTEKAELEQLAKDIEDLLDTKNLTEDERKALEEVQDQVQDMIDAIEDAAEDSKAATDTIDARDPATVTSDDKEALEQAIKTIDELLAEDHLTEDERKALEDAKADASALLDVIEAAQAALDTENAEKVEDVTADNVKPEDKDALIDAKADLEKALEGNAGNYTEEEKQAIRDEIQRIEDAIEALENVEDVTDAITQLPDTVEPDDEEAAEKILGAKEAYDELTDHEKSLIEKDLKEKLEDLMAALTDYKIVKGNNGKWTKGSSYGLSFTANGPFSKFEGIEVDGEKISSLFYDAKSGSTIITLKRIFLSSLRTGEHTITVLYTEGEATGTFKILAKTTSPATGDDSNIILYGSMFTVSLAGLVVLLLAAKKRKQKTA